MTFRSCVRLWAALMVSCSLIAESRAAAPVVAGFERFGKTDAAAGQLLLGELNCIACHQPAQASALAKQAPVLDDVGGRLKASYFKKFLTDPQAAKPGTTMPHVFAADPDAAGKIEALAQFLASTGTTKQDADAKFAKGRDLYHALGCVACHGTRDAQGQPDKTTASSVPLGDLKAKYTNATLATFLSNPHAARPSGRMPSLLITGDGKQKANDARELANYLTQGVKGAKYDDEKVVADPALVAKGKTFFVSEGCANCHQMKGTTSASKAPALAKLTGVGGCLSAAPTKGAPWFSLSDAQKTALAAAIKTPPPAATEPAQLIASAMLAFNCYACHSRGTIGGPEDELNKSFLTAQPEMGDEARIPPPLDNVGGKINLDYLKKILANGSHDRPYMTTRMPAFGPAAAHLPAAFAEADKGKFPPTPEIAAEPPGKVKTAGRHLIGANAFSCYKCHTFAGKKAEGVQGIDMTLFTARLRPEWFHAYVIDPQKIRPGTRMPAAFDKGKSLLPNVLDGTAASQIDAMWTYLKDGQNAKLPEGMSAKGVSIQLKPVTDAIIYRNFIEGAGNRAIGVGYPERVNLAFDANDVRLAMLWQGAFMDAGRHWSGRGEGRQPPLGDNVLHLASGPSFAILASREDAWPKGKTPDTKFGGYQLSPDDRPTFLYSIGGAKVNDLPNALVGSKDGNLRRTFELTAPNDVSGLHYRAAVGKKIEKVGDGVYSIDDAYRTKLTAPSAPIIRQSGDRMELLVPVPFTDGKAKIVQDYNW